MMDYHIPVLLQESIDGLQLKPDGIYVDATFGGGGHSREILRTLKTGLLIAFDQDPDSKASQIQDERFLFIRHNFRYLGNFLRYYGIEQIDGLLADLGVSSHQIDSPERGFSYRFDAELDMRMNPGSGETASDVLSNRSGPELENIFRKYGELPAASLLASRIVAYREKRALITVGNLTEAIGDALPKKFQAGFLSKLFQALRIEVNQELECLEELLAQGTGWLKTEGRLVIISYHSLEDRMVKNFIRAGNAEGHVEKDLFGNFYTPLKAVNRNVIVPSEEEIRKNSRARSARMRIAEKVNPDEWNRKRKI